MKTSITKIGTTAYGIHKFNIWLLRWVPNEKPRNMFGTKIQSTKSVFGTSNISIEVLLAAYRSMHTHEKTSKAQSNCKADIMKNAHGRRRNVASKKLQSESWVQLIGHNSGYEARSNCCKMRLKEQIDFNLNGFELSRMAIRRFACHYAVSRFAKDHEKFHEILTLRIQTLPINPIA